MIEHGKSSTYNNKKCRCELCKAAWAAYLRERARIRREAKEDPALAKSLGPPHGPRHPEVLQKFSVWLPAVVVDAFKVQAAARGVTVARLLRETIERGPQ